ncbi:MAG: CoA ester lyase [Gammaproteobacteria bacterium]
MLMRSVLFVPGGSEKMLSKCDSLPGDILMLDLEDAVVPARKEAARELVANLIDKADESLRDRLWVRINSWQSGLLEEDLEIIAPLMPTGYLLPKARSAKDVSDLDRLLDNLELSDEHRRSRIISMVTEVPEALQQLGSYNTVLPRFQGMSWGAEDLSAALGASRNRDANGEWLPIYEFARTQCRIAAASANVAALDTVFTDYKNSQGLERYASNAARDGFDGMLAIHPNQVDSINAAFTPTSEEVDYAYKVIRAFDDNPGAGAIGLEGMMLDLPHLVQAKRVLQRHESIGASKS